jgi:hypothetical protein
MAAPKGPLQTKLEPRLLPLLADRVQQLEVVAEWVEEDHGKLLALCAAMHIEDGPNQFYNLALTLARKHIVGFQERKPTRKWTPVTLGYLVVEIERKMEGRRNHLGHTASWAADVLAKGDNRDPGKDRWRKFLGGKGEDRGEALRVQYQAFWNDPWARICRKAFKLHLQQETLPEWEKGLDEALTKPDSQ